MHVARLAVWVYWVYWVYLIYCSENALRMQLYYMQSDARPQFSNQMIVFIRIPFQFLSVWCCWEKLRAFVTKAWTDDTTDHKADSRHNLMRKGSHVRRIVSCHRIGTCKCYAKICQMFGLIGNVQKWNLGRMFILISPRNVPKKGTFVATQRKHLGAWRRSSRCEIPQGLSAPNTPMVMVWHGSIWLEGCVVGVWKHGSLHRTCWTHTEHTMLPCCTETIPRPKLLGGLKRPLSSQQLRHKHSSVLQYIATLSIQ